MIDKELFAEQANERFRLAKEFWGNWRTQARDDYAFVSGDQWIQEDVSKLEEERRPAITFNYSEKMIDAVVGAEVSSRQETNYAPRGVEDAPLAELWNAAAKYVRGNCNAEDEESDAFRDALICGLGWTWTRLSYDEDLDGEIIIERVDPLEMYPDPASSKPGLKDRRWHDRVWWISEKDARTQWPDTYFPSEDQDYGTGVITAGHRYSEDNPEDDQDRHKGQVQIRLHETFEFETVYRLATSNGVREVDEATFKDAKKKMGPLPDGSFVKQRKKVYYRAFFAGDTLLELKKSPCQEGFCFQAITAKRDRNRNTWYGLTKVMKDPQRWANKWLSQVLHIVNSNAKGGLLAEIGAFVNPREAQDDWAKPNSVTLLNEGGIAKIKEKGQSQYPNGLDRLMSFALDALPMVTGINLEALGLANREQAGVLEQQRKQAAYGLLSPVFDALRRYRKEQGAVLLYYINHYISDGRLIRIGGPESQQFLPLTKSEGAPKYDIIVDQSPNSPDTKEKTWETLATILPNMMKAGLPIPPDMLDYTPLPTSLVSKWKDFISQTQQANQQMQQQMGQLQQENEQLKNDQAVKMQELDLERAKAQAKLDMEQQQMQSKIQLEKAKAQADFELEAFKQDRQFELENRRMQHEQRMTQQKSDNEFKIKAFTSGMNPDENGNFSVGLDTGGIEQMMQQFMQASQQIMQQAQMTSQMTQEALRSLQDAISRPRKLVFDKAGRPVGSAPSGVVQ